MADKLPFQCLRLTPEDKLLVRGATCALGYAAVQLAKALGCTVAGTTHRESKLELLKNLFLEHWNTARMERVLQRIFLLEQMQKPIRFITG